MKKASATNTKEGNPTTRPPAGDSSKVPTELVAKPPVLAPTIFPILDIRTEWQSTSVPEPTTAEDPKEATFLKELEEKFGSKEEAKRIFALFSAMHQDKSTGATAAVPPPPTIPEEPTAQPSIAHPDAPQASTRVPAHDQSHAEEEEPRRKRDSGYLVAESDKMVVDDGGIVADEGETLVERSVEGETPVFETAVGETPRKSEGETPFLYVEGGTPFTSVAGETDKANFMHWLWGKFYNFLGLTKFYKPGV